jgi:hypothetical protein
VKDKFVKGLRDSLNSTMGKIRDRGSVTAEN